MSVYRCRCGNIQINKQETSEGGKGANVGTKPGGMHAKVLFPSLVKVSPKGVTRCLVCNTDTFKTVGEDNPVEVLVDENESELHESASFSPALGLAFPSASSFTLTSPSRPRRFPSPPALPTSYAQPTTLLPTAPDPFFLPHPFSPSHPAFRSITTTVETHLRTERQHLVDEVAAFLDAKRKQFEDLCDKTRSDVEEIWKIFEDGEREREEQDGTGGGGRKVVEGAATPRSTQKFPKELEGGMSSSIASLVSPSTTGSSGGSYKPGFVLPSGSSPSTSSIPASLPRRVSSATNTAALPSRSIPVSSSSVSAAPSSLLSASLHQSTLLTNPPTYIHADPPSFQPPSRRMREASTEKDKDLASSLIASTWQEPANLIFRTAAAKTLALKRPETVREEESRADGSSSSSARGRAEGVLGEGGKSESLKERDEQMGTQAVATTPPAEYREAVVVGGEEEVGFIEEAERRRRSAGSAEPEVERKGKGKKRQVTFIEPPTADEDELAERDDEEVVIMDGNHQEVFDFEEPEVPSSTSSLSPPPIDESAPAIEFTPAFSLVRASSSSNQSFTVINSAGNPSSSPLPELENGERTARPVKKQEPMYTLQGQAIRPVPSHKSLSRSPSVNRRTEAEKELSGENNRVLVSMKKLTAADLPSHRAAWKGKPREWQIYGRFGGRDRSGSLSSGDDEAGEDAPSETTHYGKSLPVNILPPPGTFQVARDPLERKTSLSDRQMLVPPLRTATTSTTNTTSPSGRRSSSSSITGDHSDLVRRTSSSSGTRRRTSASLRSFANTPAIDPGPGLVEEEGEEDGSSGGESGFVPPHLRGAGGGEDGVLGWASSVVG